MKAWKSSTQKQLQYETAASSPDKHSIQQDTYKKKTQSTYLLEQPPVHLPDKHKQNISQIFDYILNNYLDGMTVYS